MPFSTSGSVTSGFLRKLGPDHAEPFETPPVNKRRGDTGGERTPLSACYLHGAARAEVNVLPTSSSTVNGMDVLAEEFGSLSPEQLAAPIPTVEVSAVSAGSGRGWRRLRRRRCRESFREDEGGSLGFCARSGLLHMLRAPLRVREPLPGLVSGVFVAA